MPGESPQLERRSDVHVPDRPCDELEDAHHESERESETQAVGIRAARGTPITELGRYESAASVGAAILARVHEPKLSFNAAGEKAVLNAIFGGAGHEFVALR